MSNAPTLQEIEETAVHWVLRSESPEWNGTTDRAALNQWLEASLSHRISFVRMRSMGRQIENGLKRLAPLFPAGQVPPRGALEPARLRMLTEREQGPQAGQPTESSSGVSDASHDGGPEEGAPRDRSPHPE